ncbi:MAG: ATP-binding protein [Nitrosomonadales bacterium]
MGDALRLRQVLVNLANNAIKFSSGREQRGRVSIRVLLAERRPEQVVVEIRVTDNGIGMDEQAQSRLFTPFSQADVSTTRRFGGSGLGLVICLHLIKLMGGKIAVQSEPDKGSTFTVHLPFVPLPEKPQAAATSPLIGLRCLVIGGTEGLAGDMAIYLVHDGATVERAVDMAAALALASMLESGQWIWIVDATVTPLPLDALRATTITCPKQDIRFVVIRHGEHAKPHTDDVATVWLNANALTRKGLLKAVAIAAGQVQEEEKETPLPRQARGRFQSAVA